MVKTFFFLFLSIGFLFGQFDWVDNGAPIRQGEHIEWQRTADNGANGEVIFAWSDTRESLRDIYAQKLDANGNILWQTDGVPVAQTYGRQEDPLLVSDDQGGAFIIWIDYRDEPDTQGDVYAQHILSDGTLVWDVSGFPIAVKPGQQFAPNMCKDGEGGAYIIWKDGTFGQFDRVYATHISSDNNVIAPSEGIPIIANNTSSHPGISLETAGNGEAAMVWPDDRNGDLDIYGQRIKVDYENNTISTLWSTVEEGGRTICDADGDQNYAKITYAAGCCGTEGITVATWQDDRNGNFDIYMQYLWVNGDSYFQDYPQGFPVSTDENDQTKPRVKADHSGAYIAWFDSNDIYAQKIIFSQDDPIQWQENGLPICEAIDVQTDARLSVDGEGGVYFVWQDDRNGGSNADVYLQHVGSDDQFTYESGGKIISDAALIQKSPVVRNDGSGGAFIIWEDKREGSGAIYVQHMDYMSDVSFEENGKFIYYGTDGESLNINAVSIDSNKSLLYWEDHEQGELTKTFGKIISDGYGDSYEQAYNSQNKSLSDNPSQYNPVIKSVDNKLFFGFLQDNYEAQAEPYEGYSQYFQFIDLPDLDLIGDQNGTWLNPSDSYQYSFIADNARSVVLSVNEDNEIFYFTSLSEFFAGPDIYVRKVASDGSVLWDAPINLTNDPNTDSFAKAAFSNPENGSFVFYGTTVGSDRITYITSIDQDGNLISGFPKRLTEIDSQQFIQDAVDTGEGIFVLWSDNRSGDNSLYGQYFDYSGNRLGPDEGIVVADYLYDQSNARIAFNDNANEIFVCYEDYYAIEATCEAIIEDSNFCNETIDCSWYSENEEECGLIEAEAFVDDNDNGIWDEGETFADENGNGIWDDQEILSCCVSDVGSNNELYCNTLDMSTLQVNDNDGEPLYVIQDGQGDQINPDVQYASNGHYMIVWEDSRFDDGNNYQTHTDIYYQEIDELGAFVYPAGGIPVCNAFHIQTEPKIVPYIHSSESQSYMVYWRDLRSTGKELLYNLYAQSITHDDQLDNSNNFSNEFSLNSVYPNPFNPELTISLFSPQTENLSVKIYDLTGRLVEELYDGSLNYGHHNFVWNAQNYSSGIYILSLNSKQHHISSKITLIK